MVFGNCAVESCHDSRKSKTFSFPREKRKKTWKVCTAVAEKGQERGRIKRREKNFRHRSCFAISPDHSLENNDALKPRRRGNPHFSPQRKNRARAHNFLPFMYVHRLLSFFGLHFPKKRRAKKGTAVLERGLHACKREKGAVSRRSPPHTRKKKGHACLFASKRPLPLSPFLMILLLGRAIYCRPPTLLALLPLLHLPGTKY